MPKVLNDVGWARIFVCSMAPNSCQSCR